MAQRDRADTARLSRGKAAAFDTKRDTGQGHESGKIGFSLAGENEDPGKRKNEKKGKKNAVNRLRESWPEKHIREIKSAFSANGESFGERYTCEMDLQISRTIFAKQSRRRSGMRIQRITSVRQKRDAKKRNCRTPLT
ncbi:hypothetical protein ACS0PU_000422 [Formica fusca]